MRLMCAWLHRRQVGPFMMTHMRMRARHPVVRGRLGLFQFAAGKPLLLVLGVCSARHGCVQTERSSSNNRNASVDHDRDILRKGKAFGLGEGVCE
jgi:hypothetical protein